MSALLGIDLGTSSLKLLLRRSDGSVEKAREPYTEHTPDGWWAALIRAASGLELGGVDAIGLSSQVGSYVIDGTHTVCWNGPEGLSQLHMLKREFGRETFLHEIGMDHPDLISYPLPRLMYFKEAYPRFRHVCMPKELLIERLTGNYVSDIYSWRGLTNIAEGKYSRFFLEWLGISADALPPLILPTSAAGRIVPEAAKSLGLTAGTPVYTGCNDFFAGLLGAGVRRAGDLFDLTGTSEHVGGISTALLDEPSLISGAYFSGFVRYGVTASSGPSLAYARRLHPAPVNMEKRFARAPLFLPYVNGERCPVCDPGARGVMFGIAGDCDCETMAYSVMEGVAFNLKQIFEHLQMPAGPMLVCGGSALDSGLNQLKSDILGLPLAALAESDVSALGAALIAGVGCGEFPSLAQAPAAEPVREYLPRSDHDFSRRFALYKQLYPALKNQFSESGRL